MGANGQINGIELVAPHCDRFVTVDKYAATGDRHAANVEFRRMCVPPLGFGDESFDFVITFQVIEHIDDDAAFVREIARVLRPGGRMILTTPNAPMSLTRNPWHVREYRIDELRRLLSEAFSAVETHGVFGNERVMEYYEHNRRSVERIARFDGSWLIPVNYGTTILTADCGGFTAQCTVTVVRPEE